VSTFVVWANMVDHFTYVSNDNGQTWVATELGNANCFAADIIWNGNQFMTVLMNCNGNGSVGTGTSTDGVTWSMQARTQNDGDSESWKSIAFDPQTGVYIIVGSHEINGATSSPAIWRSTNIGSWANVVSSSTKGGAWDHVTFCGGVFFAVRDNPFTDLVNAMRSTDGGNTWTRINIVEENKEHWYSLTSGLVDDAPIFIATGECARSGRGGRPCVARSADLGVSWTVEPFEEDANSYYSLVVEYGAGVFVANYIAGFTVQDANGQRAGGPRTFSSSDGGLTWVSAPLPQIFGDPEKDLLTDSSFSVGYPEFYTSGLAYGGGTWLASLRKDENDWNGQEFDQASEVASIYRHVVPGYVASAAATPKASGGGRRRLLSTPLPSSSSSSWRRRKASSSWPLSSQRRLLAVTAADAIAPFSGTCLSASDLTIKPALVPSRGCSEDQCVQEVRCVICAYV
jgi:hypothetical protein